MVSEISYRPELEVRFKYFKEILNSIPITGLNFSTNVTFGKETTRIDYLKIWRGYKDEKKNPIQIQSHRITLCGKEVFFGHLKKQKTKTPTLRRKNLEENKKSKKNHFQDKACSRTLNWLMEKVLQSREFVCCYCLSVNISI